MTTATQDIQNTQDRNELLHKAATISQSMTQAVNVEKKPLIRDQRSKLRFYKNAFLGSEAVAWAIETGHASSREAATKLFDDFLTVGALLALSRKGHIFQDEAYLYSWPGESGPIDLSGRTSGSELEEEAAVGDMAKLLHLHTAIAAKNQSRHDEWKKTQLPQIRKKIEQLEAELGTWRKKLESSVESTKRNKHPDIASLMIIEDLETAVATVTAEIDNQKQLMHFPEAEGFVYRFGSDGVYIGIKHAYLEKIEAKWSVRAGCKLTENSAFKDSGSGHHFETRFSPVAVSVAFEGVSIIGEKGSGVPSFHTSHLALDMELLIEAQLKFNVNTSTWKAPYFNFNLVDVGKTDVLGLPPTMLQWVINKFAPARVKSAILSALPVTLGKYLSGGQDIFEMSGGLSVRGIPFSVLEAELQMSKTPTAGVSPADLPESHWSALKLLNTGIDCITHGHILALLRRRLSLQALGRNSLFKYCSKWSSLSQLLTYVRTLDRETSSMEYTEIMRTWQHALNTVTAEEGLSVIDLEVMFARLRLLDKVPFEVRYVISEFSGSLEAGRLVDFVKDIGNEFLNAAKTDLTDVKVLNEMRKVRSFHEIDVWHKETSELLAQATQSIQKVSMAVTGKLLGGKKGIFDVGVDSILARLKPGIELPVSEYLMAPSDLSMSLFAIEDDSGKFIIDVGVPKTEKITEELKETEYDELLSLCTGEFWKRENNRTEALKAAEVYEGCKHFPTHDRVVMMTLGPSQLSLRADIASLIQNLTALEKDKNGMADLLTLGFKPSSAGHDDAKTSSGSLSRRTSLSFSDSSRSSVSSSTTTAPRTSSSSSTTDSLVPRSSTSLFTSSGTDNLSSTAPRTSVSSASTSAPSTASSASEAYATALSSNIPPTSIPLATTTSTTSSDSSADNASSAAPRTSISLSTETAPARLSTSQSASSTSHDSTTDTSALTLPQTTISSASVALPPADLPPAKSVSAPPSPINTVAFHLAAPVPAASTVGLSATVTALLDGTSPTTVSEASTKAASATSDSSPARRNSLGAPPAAELSRSTSQSSSAVKRNSFSNAGSGAASNSSTRPSYTLSLTGVPDLFAELKIRNFHIMGAPRRISRFVHKTIKQTAQGTEKDTNESASVSASTETKPATTSELPSTSSLENSEKKTESKGSTSELDPISVALRHFIRDIGSESMLCRFAQGVDVTVRDDKLYLTLSRSNNKEVDSRPFVFSNTYIAQDLFEKVMKVYNAVEKVRNEN